MNDSTNLVQHLDPTQDRFQMAGIALLAEGHEPGEVREFYLKTGAMPHVHPSVLYEVAKRGIEGDKLRRTYISLDDERLLELGGSFCRVHTGRFKSEPSEADIELARQTLQMMGILSYNATATSGDGRNVLIQVDVTKQIHDLIDLHLATPVRES